MIKNYLTFSSRLAKIYLCIDLSYGLKDYDKIIFDFMLNLQIPIQIVLTKIDQVFGDQIFQKTLALS